MPWSHPRPISRSVMYGTVSANSDGFLLTRTMMRTPMARNMMMIPTATARAMTRRAISDVGIRHTKGAREHRPSQHGAGCFSVPRWPQPENRRPTGHVVGTLTIAADISLGPMPEDIPEYPTALCRETNGACRLADFKSHAAGPQVSGSPPMGHLPTSPPVPSQSPASPAKVQVAVVFDGARSIGGTVVWTVEGTVSGRLGDGVMDRAPIRWRGLWSPTVRYLVRIPLRHSNPREAPKRLGIRLI
jgi:hypothetical protein